MSPVPAMSAGILLFRRSRGELQVLIGHPGGPLWANKQEGAWSIPKGIVEPGEQAQVAALREFAEETGHIVNSPDLIDLGAVVLRSGKRVVAWGAIGDLDPASVMSNLVSLEWPRGSGQTIEFPEIDAVQWCSPRQAMILLNPAQGAFVVRLQEKLDHVG